MLTGWPFRSGASWSEEYIYLCSKALPTFPLLSADSSLLLSTLQNLLLVLVLVLMLPLLAAWLLAWSCLHGLNWLKRRALQLDEGDIIIDEMNEKMELLVPIEKDLKCCFLATSLPSLPQSTSSPCSPPPPWYAPWGFCKPCCFQRLLYAVVMLHRPGVCGTEVGMQHSHFITQPLFG